MKLVNYRLVAVMMLLVTTALGQADLTITLPEVDNGNSTLRAPNGTTSHSSVRAHTIYSAAEMANVPTGSVLNRIGFELNNGASGGSASGTFKIYLENTSDVSNTKSTDWSAATASMTLTFDGTYNIPNATTETFVDIVLDNGFTYTGGGLYIAYEYIGSAYATTAANYKSNTDIASAVKMYSGTSTTPSNTLNLTSSFRPLLRVTFPNPYTNELDVIAIAPEFGKVSGSVQNQQNIRADIRNSSSQTLTNAQVTLSITGANPFTTTQSIPSITAGETVSLMFNNVAFNTNGQQTIEISVPNDDNNANNLLQYAQGVSCDTLAYTNSEAITSAVGFNTGSGILANRYAIPATVETHVPSMGIYIGDGTAIVGNTLRGVLCNSSGIVVDSTFFFVVTNAMLGTRVELNFINGEIDHSGTDIYVGIRQFANTSTGYFPVATQNREIVPADAFYALDNAGDTTSYTNLGMFMIEAVLAPQAGLSDDSNGGRVCPGTTVTYTGNAGFSNYQFNVDGNSAQNGANNVYAFVPVDTQMVALTVDLNHCSFTSPMLTIESSVFRDSLEETICEGGSFTVGPNTYTQAGIYLDTLVSVSGCDSIVRLDLAIEQVADGQVSATICQGESYDFNGTLYTDAGVYSSISQTANGCDSLTELTLTVTPIDLSVSQSGSVLTTGATSGVQWINCDTGFPITGATNSTYQVIENGNYAAIVTNGNCSDTTECVEIDLTGLSEFDLSAIQVYPNPSNGFVEVSGFLVGMETMLVYDLNGRLIQAFEVHNATKMTFNVSEWESGTYLIRFNGNRMIQPRKLVVQP